MVLETIMKFCMTAQDFFEKLILLLKLNLKKNLAINFHWSCCIMTMYIICCVPSQILYWEKSCFWYIGENAFSQSNYRIFKSTISVEQINEIASFVHVDRNLQKLKFVENFLIGHGQKWMWAIWSLDSKFGCYSRMNRLNQLIFCMLVQIHAS